MRLQEEDPWTQAFETEKFQAADADQDHLLSPQEQGWEIMGN